MRSRQSRNSTRQFQSRRKSVRPTARLRGIAIFDALESHVLFDALAWTPGVSLPSARGGASAINAGGDVLIVGGSTTAGGLRVSARPCKWSMAPVPGPAPEPRFREHSMPASGRPASLTVPTAAGPMGA